MLRALSLSIALATSLPLGGCSSDDDDGGRGGADALAMCEDTAKGICSKYYECYSDAELAMMTNLVGTDEASCVDAWTAKFGCSTNPTGCDEGQTYDAVKARECVNGYTAFSAPTSWAT